MTAKARPYRLSYPLSARQVEDLDQMIGELYTQLAALGSSGGSGLPSDPLSVDHGGTGVASIAGVLLGNGPSPITGASVPSDATKFLNGAATPAFAQVKGSDLSMSDVTTNDVVSTKHGFAPKSPADATKFLNGAATPGYAQVKDSDLSVSDITTNNASTSKHGFTPKLPGDATKFLDGTGAFSAVTATGFTGIKSVVKSSNETVTSSVALQDDDELTLAIGANETWLYELVLLYTAAASSTAGRLKVAFNGPASPTAAHWSATGIALTGTTNVGSLLTGALDNITDSEIGVFGGAGTTKMQLILKVVVQNGANAGNIKLRWAQGVSSATATVVYAGSYMWGLKV